ncbi:MAG: hypothetical protein WCX88_01060 [Patescibacteria group bacterium]
MPQIPERDLEKKVDELLKTSKETAKKVDKIYHWHRMSQIFFWLKFLIIVLIIVSAWIYIPPFISKMATPYQSIIDNYQKAVGTFDNVNQVKDNLLKK